MGVAGRSERPVYRKKKKKKGKGRERAWRVAMLTKAGTAWIESLGLFSLTL